MGIEVQIAYTPPSDSLSDEMRAALMTGVSAAGERLLALAVEQVPLDDGILSNSGAVSTPLGSQGGDPEVEVIFDTPYAARLHEHPEYNFQGGRKGKYLEDPAMENKDEFGEIITTAVQRRMGGAA